MLNRVPKTVLLVAFVLLWLVLGLANRRPGYFANPQNLGYLLLIEALVASIWMYRKFYFLILILSFLLAGVNLPVGGGIWTAARWAILAIGAFVGTMIMLKSNPGNFRMFHVLALLAALTALMSATVSPYSSLSLSKVLSFFLLLLYGATGARLAVMGREGRFFSGLLIGCEVFVVCIGILYFAGIEAMGNPNSLGAVMGVVAVPILLWGTLVRQSSMSYWRRILLYSLAVYLTYASHARAGMLAAFVSSVVLCLALRRYRMLGKGLVISAVIVASVAIFQPETLSRVAESFKSDVIFKGQNPEQGVFSSRDAPWRDTMTSINQHLWFGTGFGTSDTGQDPTDRIGTFSSSSVATEEHGSSYWAIVSWVGLAGILPFALLIGALLGRIVQSILWMYRTADPAWGFVPLAIVTLAGLVHAGFEDWLFAPGYYLCVFFWSCAFILLDEFQFARSYFMNFSNPGQTFVKTTPLPATSTDGSIATSVTLEARMSATPAKVSGS